MAEVEGSFSAGAVVVSTIFEDTFTRTVSGGLGGPWTWHWYDSNTDADTSPFEVNGTYAVWNTKTKAESWVGFPRPLTGELWFDFWVPATWLRDYPTYGICLDPTNYTGVYLRSWDTNGIWRLMQWGTETPYEFTPTANTWYRVHGRWTDDRMYANVWPRADAEPSGWQYDQPTQLDIPNSADDPPFLDMYYGADTGLEARWDNIKILSTASGWTGFGNAQAAAVIAEDPNHKYGNLTANAIVTRSFGDGTTAIPQYASIATATSNGANNLVISKPSGTASGDTLIAIISFDAQGSTTRDMVPDLAGWTSIGKSTPANGDHSVTFWKRTAGSSEPSSYTFNVSPTASVESSGSILRVTNPVGEVLLWTKAVSYANTVHPVPATGDGPTTPGPDIYSSIPGLLVYAAGGSVAGATWTPPTGMTERADIRSSSWSSLEVATEDVTGPFIGTRSATSSFSVIDVLGLLLLLPTGRFMSADAEFLAHRFSADAVILPKDAGHLGAVIQKTITPYIFGSAVVRRTDILRSATVRSFIVSPYRTLHSRGTPPHYDNDLDTVIEIAEAIGVYARGSTVHEVLTGIYARLAAIEGIDNIPVARLYTTMLGNLNLGSVLRRIFQSSALLDAVVVAGEQSGSFTADAVVGSVAQNSFAADSIFMAAAQSALTLDSVVSLSTASSFAADSITLATRSTSLMSDAVIQAARSGSLVADAVIGTSGLSDFQSDAFQSDTFE